MTDLNTAEELSNQAELCASQGSCGQAESLFKQSLAVGEQALGADHPEIANILTKLALLYFSQGLYDLAEPLFKRALAIREKALGFDHLLTASCLSNLASIYDEEDIFGLAEPLFKRALEIIEQKLGNNCLATATGLDKLACLYQKRGLFDQAKPCFQRALEIREALQGPDHADTATSLNGLAKCYFNKGLYAQAEPLYQRALAIYEQMAPLEHLNISAILDNLAALYFRQGLYAEAEPLIRRSLAICEDTLGKHHPSTGASLTILACLYQKQSLCDQAEPLYRHALAICEQAFGQDHPSTATCLDNLAGLYCEQGLFRKAEVLYQRALDTCRQALGVNHPNTAASLCNLASLYITQRRYSQADTLCQQALLSRKQNLGLNHPETAESLNQLAILRHGQGRFNEAEQFYMQALAIREAVLGPSHDVTASSLNNMALLYMDQGLHAQAESLLQQVLEVCERRLGFNHPDTADTIRNLALVFRDQKRYKEARALYSQALEIQERGPRSDCIGISFCLNGMALLYMEQGLHEEAEPLLRRALEICEHKLESGHPFTETIRINMAYLYAEWHKYSAAISLFNDSLRSQLNWLHREAPLMATANRRRLLGVHGEFGGLPLNLAAVDPGFPSLFLFARLNRHGLLQQIEQRQAQLAKLPGEHQPLVERVQSLVTVLASSQLEPERRRALAEERDQLEAQLYRLLPELQIRTVEISDVAAALPAGGVLIEFQRYIPMVPGPSESGAASRYLAFILLPDERIEAIDLGPAAPLEAAIEEARADTIAGFADASEAWHAVSQRLLTPLLPHLDGCSQWYLSLDGELHRVPFHLLPLPEQPDQLLVETVSLQLVTSGRDLIDHHPTTASSSSAGPALVVADPAFDHAPSAASQGAADDISHQLRSRDMGALNVWSPLPATAEEGKQLSALLGAQLLTGQDATTLAVQQAQHPRVLHIATHGFFLPDQVDSEAAQPWRPIGSDDLLARFRGEDPMLRSGLVFAGANHPVTDPEDDDGYLTALEAVHLDLAGTELVTLSACDTGSGDIHTGEGVYGLQRALIVAGARSMLLSLWPVPDEATSAFMVRFYTLLQQGAGRYEALVAVQREFRHHDNIVWRHPYYWGAWQLIGDGGPIPDL